VGKRYLFIANPAACGGKCAERLEELRRVLDSRPSSDGFSYEIIHTMARGDATRIASVLSDSENTSDYVIVAMGGDGTVNEVAQGLEGSSSTMGGLALGTGNDFARALSLPKSLEAQVDVLIRGKTRPVDAGRLNGHRFINVAGMGFDAAVNIAHYDVRFVRGIPAYMVAVFTTYWNFKPLPVRAEIWSNGNAGPEPSEIIEKELFMLTVGNGPTCGGGLKITPDADVFDGFLDLNVLDPLPGGALLMHVPKLFTGTIHHTKYSEMKRFTKMRVTSQVPLPANLDGETYVTGLKEYEVEVEPGAINVIGNF